MYHSITIGEFNTWDDFYLVPKTIPSFAPPAPKTNYQDIPGADGAIDLSTALTGDIMYNNRTGTIDFIIEKGHRDWEYIYSEILNKIHGKRLKIILEDDNLWYYMGRFWVSAYSNGKHNPELTMSYSIEPYKCATYDTDAEWMWDPFSFEAGNAFDWFNLQVNGKITVECEWGRKTVVPVFYFTPQSNTSLTITIGNYTGTYAVTNGKINYVVDPNLQLVQGRNEITVIGYGKLDIHATERSL